MTLEEAIQTALDYEEKVRDVYIHARADAINDIGKRVFKALAKEEQGHVDYLYQKLAELQNTGRVTAGKIDSVIPTPAAIKAGVEKLENRLVSDDRDNEIRLLKKALQVEVETSDFYKKMVQELDPEGQKFFAPFLEIEEGHVMLVQAELDCVSGTGFWFDMQEFSLEM